MFSISFRSGASVLATALWASSSCLTMSTALADTLVGTNKPDMLVGSTDKSLIKGLGGDDFLWGESSTGNGPNRNIIRASVASDGKDPNAGSFGTAMSGDGRLVVFSSDATNIVDGDSNGTQDIFLFDRSTRKSYLVSRASDNSQGFGAASSPDIASDGQSVVFSSNSTNLDLVHNNSNITGIFLKDISGNNYTGGIEAITKSTTGGIPNANSSAPIFSPDGRKIAFVSVASNLVNDDNNGFQDIFVWSANSQTITRVSTSSAGIDGNSISSNPVFSPDGKKLLFRSYSSNLVANDTNNMADVFLKDLETGAISLVSTNSAGKQGNQSAYDPDFSPDGKSVIFATGADNLVPNDKNGNYDIFIKDLSTGALRLVSTDAKGKQIADGSYTPIFLPDGSKIAFSSWSAKLDPLDGNNTGDLFIKDLVSGKVSRVSTGKTGLDGDAPPSFPSNNPRHSISDDGQHLLFYSEASTLVPPDSGGFPDIFVVDLAAPTGKADILIGGKGADKLHGVIGDDLLDGGPSEDFLDGGKGRDTATYATATGGVTADLTAGAGSFGDAAGDEYVSIENLIGTKFIDVLTGDRFANFLTGGKSLDTLTGKKGADHFIYLTVDDSPKATPDIIQDFSTTEKDVIDLKAIDAIPATAGVNDAFTFIGSKPFGKKAGQLRLAKNKLEGDVNGDGSADFVIRLPGVTKLDPVKNLRL